MKEAFPIKIIKKIKSFFKKLNEPICHDTIRVYTAPSGTQYVCGIDLLLSKEEKEQLYARAEEKFNQTKNPD